MYARKKQQLQLTYLDWYAPNVGLIRTVTLEGGPTGPEMDRVELVRFNVTPAGADAHNKTAHSGYAAGAHGRPGVAARYGLDG